MGLGAKGQAEDRECCQPAELRHDAKITSQSPPVAHALLRAASSLTRRLRALEQRASAKVPTRHAGVRAPRPPAIQCEAILASGAGQVQSRYNCSSVQNWKSPRMTSWIDLYWQLIRPYGRCVYYMLFPWRRPRYFQEPWKYPRCRLGTDSIPSQLDSHPSQPA